MSPNTFQLAHYHFYECALELIISPISPNLKKAMTIILKKGVSLDEINEKIMKTKPVRKKHAFEKYVGILAITEDPLQIQKKLRNEWE